MGIVLDSIADVRDFVSDEKYIYGVTDKEPLSYTVGDDITFNVSLYAGAEKVSCPEFSWEVVTDDGKNYSGKSSGLNGDLKVTVPATGAGYVRLKVFANDENGDMIPDVSQVSHLNGPAIFSAGVDVDTLSQEMTEPEDFDNFWASQLAILDSVEPDLLEYKFLKEENDFYYYIVKIAGNDDIGFVSGYLTYPKNATKNSLKLKVVSFAFSSMDVYIHANTGYATLNIAPHSIELQQDASYYKKLRQGIYKNIGFYNNETIEGSYFRPMILRHIQGLRFLKAYLGNAGILIDGERQSLNLWNGKDISVHGGSQGGFLSLAIAGLDNDVNDINADSPWLCDIGGGVNSSHMNSCFRPAYTEALDYIDSLNFAKRISVYAKILLQTRLGDYVCPPSGHTVLFNILKDTHNVNWRLSQGCTHGFKPIKYDTYFL